MDTSELRYGYLFDTLLRSPKKTLISKGGKMRVGKRCVTSRKELVVGDVLERKMSYATARFKVVQVEGGMVTLEFLGWVK